MPVFAEVLADRLRHDPGQPLLTYYDLATGERVELSVTTYANWVAKTASLLADEHGLERGDRLQVDLPTHWLGPVVLGAAWTVGLVVTTKDGADGEDGADGVVCGPTGLADWAPRAADVPVLACALLPLGVRFADPLPPGVHDVGVEVWGQPDAFTAWDPPGPDDAAIETADGVRTHADLWRDGDDRRVLSALNPVDEGLPALSAALVGGGSLVLATSADPSALADLAAQENAVRP